MSIVLHFLTLFLCGNAELDGLFSVARALLCMKAFIIGLDTICGLCTAVT